MERTKQGKITAPEDRLSELPDSILIDILSLFPSRKSIVRSCVLSKRWRFLWKSVPISLHFGYGGDRLVATVNRELYYARFFDKITEFAVSFEYDSSYEEDYSLWVYFATQTSNVEDFTLANDGRYAYEFPQFGFKSSSLKHLFLRNCELEPKGNVSWNLLVSLSIADLPVTDALMEKFLTGCPNLECLEIDGVWGISRLEIGSKKLKKLIIKGYVGDLEIFAPYVQDLQLFDLRYCSPLLLKNVDSLVAVLLDFKPDLELCRDRDRPVQLEKMCWYLKELLHILVHVKNLELGPWCIQLLSILELKGWQSPPSGRKFLKLNTALEQLDFPGVYNLLQSSSDLETLVIDWRWRKPKETLSLFTNKDEKSKEFQMHNFNCSLLHLKTIKIFNFHGALSEDKFVMPLVQYLLKNAQVLEKLAITAILYSFKDVSRDYAEMAKEFQSYPKSSPHASVVFSTTRQK